MVPDKTRDTKTTNFVIHDGDGSSSNIKSHILPVNKILSNVYLIVY